MSSPQQRLLALAALLAVGFGLWAWLRPDPASETTASAAAGGAAREDARGHLDGADDADPGPTGLPWQRPTATVSGTVRAEAGDPIADAKVCVWSEHGTLPSLAARAPKCVTTGRDGRYRIEELPPVYAEVHATKRGFVPDVFERDGVAEIGLRPGIERADVDLVLAPGGVEVTGVVKDLSGGVVEGALVTVHSTFRMGWRDKAGRAVTRSGADGTFSAWAAEGDVLVRAYADGYGSTARTGVAPGYTFELFMTPESVLAGRVVMADSGEPVADAIVSSAPSGFAPSLGGRAVTDADGRFRIDQLEPGRYHPTAEADAGYGRSPTSVTVGLAETSDEIVIELHPMATISGRLILADGDDDGCQKGSINLSQPGDASAHEWTKPDPDGTFVLRGVQPGTYDVKVECRGYVARSDLDPLTVATESIEGIEWTLDRGLSATGTVVDSSGKPVAKANVIASAKVGGRGTGDRRYVSTKTDATGAFTVEALVPGDYGLEVRAQGLRSTPERIDFSVAPGTTPDPIEIVLELGGTVTGSVRDQNGDAVGGAIIHVQGDWSVQARTTDDGAFSLAAIEPGDRRITASLGFGEDLRAPGTTDDSVQGEAVKVVSGETATVDLVVALDDGEISGTVVDADGGPVADAFIDKERESDSAAAAAGGSRSAVHWSGWDSQPVLTDQDGTFSLSKLPAGKYTLRAYRKGGGEGIVEHVDVGSTGVTVQLADSGEVHGTVTLLGGGHPDKFNVTVSDKTQGVWQSDEFFRTDGVFAFDGLPGGTYDIAVTSTDGDATTQATLAAGAVADKITVELVPRVTASGRLLDLITQEPVPGMQVTISPRKGGGGFQLGGKDDAPNTTDDRGHFRVDDAPAGKVRLMIIPRDFGDETYGWTNLYAAIPTDAKQHDMGDLYVVPSRKKRSEEDGYFGFKLEERPPEVEPEDHPRRVAVVRPGGPAAAAGLKIGDVIVSVDGHDVTAPERASVYSALTNVKPGTTVELGLESGDSVSITAGKQP